MTPPLPRLIVRPRATEDLSEQFLYYAQEASKETALRFLEAAEATFEDLRQMPGSGVRRAVGNPALGEVRQWRVKGFESILIFYQVTEDALYVLRVLHGARNINHILLEEDEG